MSNRGVLALSLLLSVVVSVNRLSAQTAAVQVQVLDYADLKPAALHQLTARIQDILVGAGISVQVRLCRGSLAVPCEMQTGRTRRLVVRVLAGEAKSMSNVRRPPLGQSFTDHGGGTYASVFLGRVQDVAAEVNVPWMIVLSYAAAHEVGHLLLGEDAHTVRGLMKASWDRQDYEAMYQKHFHFSPEQVRQLASRYGGSGEVQGLLMRQCRSGLAQIPTQVAPSRCQSVLAGD